MMPYTLNIEDITELFDEVQRRKIFPDQKTMADAIPESPANKIMKAFVQEKDLADFNLKDFVLKHFKIKTYAVSKHDLTKDFPPIDTHIRQLWHDLKREAPEDKGTLMRLPYPYIVPGGRFVEFFYWDSYFSMLGLELAGDFQLIENMVDNCAYLIKSVGFIPNATRTYFLTRSQPPFFALMVEKLAEIKNDPHVFLKYEETLNKEYSYWMAGLEQLTEAGAVKKVVRLEDGKVLNRYYDEKNEPRPESYNLDLESAKDSSSDEFFRDLRSACESGWDFSTRWFEDYRSISTIRTTHLLAVDLNCLLWKLEDLLSRIAKQRNDITASNHFQHLADERATAIDKYFWDEQGLYRDYDFVKHEQSLSENISMVYPLFFKLSRPSQAERVADFLQSKFLHPGGLVCTTKESGQQWDFPNAWAPYQWLGYKGLMNYGFDSEAETVARNWCTNIEKVYKQTGKLMEKYDAVHPDTIGGGGEYPNQDGFGWTNGVYMRLKQELKKEMK